MNLHTLAAAAALISVAATPASAQAQCPVGEQASMGGLYRWDQTSCEDALTVTDPIIPYSYFAWRACSLAYPDDYTVPFVAGSHMTDDVISSSCSEQGPGYSSTPNSVTTVMNFTVCCYYNPDPDADSDGVFDDVDNCPNTPNPGQADADGDTVGDACDACTDIDGDGYGDPSYAANTCGDDNCPTIANPGQDDNESDGIGDLCDDDDDNDGILDGADNCQYDANVDQADIDFDGIGDACDSFFNHTTAATGLAVIIADMMGWVSASGVPGGNGLITKLNRVYDDAVDATADYDDGLISTADYFAELQDALAALDTFDNQLAAKINNGQLANPYAADLLAASAQIRAILNAMIAAL